MTEQNVRITLRLPSGLHNRLKRRVTRSQRSMNSIIVDAIREGLDRSEYEPETSEDRAWKALRESGLWEPLGKEWLEGIDLENLPTHEELREMLKGVPPLSEIIIQERGPRE
jgi:predicted transcriptional regulator